VTGQAVDEFMYKILYDRFGSGNYPGIDAFKRFKLKTDLKETVFAPYKLKFNRAVLEEKMKLYEEMGASSEAK
jgi:hypothetical protein